MPLDRGVLRVRSIRLILPLRERLWVTITRIVVVEDDVNVNEGTVLAVVLVITSCQEINFA